MTDRREFLKKASIGAAAALGVGGVAAEASHENWMLLDADGQLKSEDFEVLDGGARLPAMQWMPPETVVITYANKNGIGIQHLIANYVLGCSMDAYSYAVAGIEKIKREDIEKIVFNSVCPNLITLKIKGKEGNFIAIPFEQEVLHELQEHGYRGIVV